jgi:hypothetical protein
MGARKIRKIIRRDAPLRAGTKIAIRAVVYFEIDVDEWLDGEATVTVEDIDREIGRPFAGRANRGATDTELFEFGLSSIKRDLGDVEFVAEIPGEHGPEDVAFETRWEYAEREAMRPSYENVEWVEVTP